MFTLDDIYHTLSKDFIFMLSDKLSAVDKAKTMPSAIGHTARLSLLPFPTNNCVPCAAEFARHFNEGETGLPQKQGICLTKQAPSRYGFNLICMTEDLEEFSNVIKEYPNCMLLAGVSTCNGNGLFGGNHAFNVIYLKYDSAEQGHFEIHDTASRAIKYSAKEGEDFIRSLHHYIRETLDKRGDDVLLSIYQPSTWFRPSSPDVQTLETELI